MQAIEYIHEGQYIGILHQPNSGDQIKETELNNLIEIIKDKYKSQKSFTELLEEEKEELNNLHNNNNELAFTQNTNPETLESICYFLQSTFGQKIIVPQIMGSGPAIRHRPLFFELNSDNNTIIVKYTTFGDFNNFNKALSILK
ncbi:hypothetical protein CPAV1605_135 [seawater metagenome]|uniref:Uncharacterized protein n=1 Tax=seawater metagenome TaxID=1561972 RepID=A0A5E8CG42_9ZZZZ